MNNRTDKESTTAKFFKAAEKANPHQSNKPIVTKINRTPQCNQWFYGVGAFAGLVFWYCS